MSRSLLPLPLPELLTTLLGRHGNSRADHRSEGTQTSSQQPSNLSRVLSQARRSQPAQHRAEAPSPVEEKKPVRARVPAVTSKARTTAPERKDARRNRRKYPSSMRQRPH